MSDAAPASNKKSAKPWTEQEKLALLYQIVDKSGTIPWAQIDLPEGRTAKACAVMVDKEKAKVRKAKEAAVSGEGDGSEEGMTPTTPAATGGKTKKRAATEEEVTLTTASAKKPRAPHKSKKPIPAEEEDEEDTKLGKAK